MPYKKTALLAGIILFIISNTQASQPNHRAQKIKNCLITSALGDALGRVTEFISSTQEIFKKYPQGVSSFADFKESDWSNIPHSFSSKKIAPYTDDTCMALLVIKELIQARKLNWDKEKTMSQIALAFIKDLENTTYGWAAPFRAPGNACLQSTYALKAKTKAKNFPQGWWDAQSAQAGGCGSVMRAFPFGLVFYDDPQKAEHWAVAHSKITHGHPIALAACAAMAVGTAHALEGSKTKGKIIEAMITAARTYDRGTAEKMREAWAYARQAQRIIDRHKLSSIHKAFENKDFRALHDKVFNEFQGWAAHDAIAATVYVFSLFPEDLEKALYTSVHTPGDSDSIAAMSGALVGAYTESKAKMVGSLENAQELELLADQIYRLDK